MNEAEIDELLRNDFKVKVTKNGLLCTYNDHALPVKTLFARKDELGWYEVNVCLCCENLEAYGINGELLTEEFLKNAKPPN